MEFIADLSLFLLKAVIVVCAIGAVIVLIASASANARGGDGQDGELQIKKLNDVYEDDELLMQESLLSPAEFKRLRNDRDKEEKKRLKESAKQAKGKAKSKAPVQELNDEESKPRVFVADFEGDVHASAADGLRRTITAILSVASAKDEVVLRLESPGGSVVAYGLAASQLDRLRSAGIPLTVCVDKVAASGGYMMACVADRIVSAPFAVLGSIGVIMQLPNFNKLLKKADIEYEQITAGEYKRTLTVFGENTESDRAKVKEDIEEVHDLFKEHVAERRPALDIAKVATGEIWYGKQAIDLQLVDQLATSDDYIVGKKNDAFIYHVSFRKRKSFAEKMGFAASETFKAVLSSLRRADQDAGL